MLEAVEEPGLWTSEGRPVPLLGIRIDAKLDDFALTWTSSQRFRNGGAKPIEAQYIFSAPADAVVRRVLVRKNDKVIELKIEEREKAFAKYDNALRMGHSAYLADQETPNTFTLSVGNLAPGEEAVVEVTITHEATLTAEGVRIAIPTTLSPRFTPDNLPPAEKTAIERRTPPFAAEVPYGIALDFIAELSSSITAITSPSHEIAVKTEGKTARVTFGDGEVPPDAEIVLHIATDRGAKPAAVVASYAGRQHIAVGFVPEAPSASAKKRAVIFLVDCSGSMSGSSINEARQALKLCLRAMNNGDRFAIARFGSTAESLHKTSMAYEPEDFKTYTTTVDGIEADLGGTELLPALELVRAGIGPKCFDVVLLTDGQVSNEREVIAYAKEHRDHWRIFTLGIGHGPNDALTKGLAEATGGQSIGITPGERIEPAVLRLFGCIGAPAITDIKLACGDADLEIADARTGVFAGQPFVCYARTSDKLKDGETITLTGTSDGLPIRLTAPVRALEGSGIPWLWARRRAAELEPDAGFVAESRSRRNPRRVENELLGLAREYGILTSVTSFVGVEKRTAKNRIKGDAEFVRVPVMLTRDWHGMESGESGVGSRSSSDFDRPSFLRWSEPDVHATLSVARHTLMAPAPIVPPRNIDLWYLDLLSTQDPSGLFPLSDVLLARWNQTRPGWKRILGGKRGLKTWFTSILDELRALAPTLTEDEAATLLALVALDQFAADDALAWTPAATKARSVLVSSGHDVQQLVSAVGNRVGVAYRLVRI